MFDGLDFDFKTEALLPERKTEKVVTRYLRVDF